MESMQKVRVVDDDQRIGRHPRLVAGAKDRHGVTVALQKPDQARARALDVARVMNDDVQPAPAQLAQECAEPLGAGRRIPAGLRKVLVEHTYAMACETDELVDRSGL